MRYSKYYDYQQEKLLQISGNANKVYNCLRSHWNDKLLLCFPCINTIMNECKLSINTVLNSIKELEQIELIQTTKEYGKVTHYFIL